MILEETVFTCQNCHFSFPSSEANVCPRCNSKRLIKKHGDFKRDAGGVSVKKQELQKQKQESQKQELQNTRVLLQKDSARVFGDTKEAWKSFHTSEMSSCPYCGGTRFSFDFKHKEKVCSNCGAVLSLRRKQV